VQEISVVMRQHNIWCVYVLSVWRCMTDCSFRHTSPNRAHVHTPYVMLPQHHTNFLHF